MVIVAAIFVTSPYRQFGQEGTQEQTEQRAKANKPPETFWQRTISDPVATFTAVLATSTAALMIVSCVQIYFLTRADKTSRAAAEAAEKSADAAILNANAAIRSELPIVSPSHIALFESDKAHSPRIIGYPPKESVFEVNFKNRGRSPAELIEICLEWSITDKLPDVPAYRSISPYAPGGFIEVNGNVPGGPIRAVSERTESVGGFPNQLVSD